MALPEQIMQGRGAPKAQAGANLPAVWHYVLTETCITVVINLAIGAMLTWKLGDPVALANAGFADTAHHLVMPTLGPASGMALGITNLTRGRVARGRAPSLQLRGLAWLPRNLLWRSAVISLAALMLLGSSAALAMVAYIQAAPLTFARLMEFMLAYAALLAAVLTPCIVLSALADNNRDIS